ncbi:MAG: [FeFe] hydrogenase, group A [Candidatus Limivivens sp.]|nr:[FeFe] hydrogenase, group A [Candidatus Limivivens sp.]
MGTMIIDGRKVEFTDEKNILSIIRKAGINLPTLCYHSELSTFGACRLCTVEDDKGRTFASCSEEPRDGMVIYTNTGRLRKYRKLIVELLLAAHCRDCTTCVKSSACVLQDLAHKMNILNVRFQNTREERPLDFSSPSLVRDPNKCILCGNCVRVCEELQGVGTLGFAFRGTDAMVMPAFNKKIAETDCVNCGQCRVYCPTGAISIKTNVGEVWDALADPNTRVVAQVAPAVRVAVGDAFGLPKGESVMGKIVAVLHRMGFDEVYDTAFSADLTIMEESQEFLERVEKGENLPLLTSCCPAWVKFVHEQYPELIPNISTCRSPQEMFSALIQEHGKNLEKKTVVVSIMPCTAKKMEILRPDSVNNGKRNTDWVITTTELIRMIRNSGIEFAALEEEACDMPFGFGSGGGVIFGVTGGVTEAVLRRLVDRHDKASMDAIAECGVRGDQGIKEFTVDYKGTPINVCVVSGLANARTVMDRVKSGEANYHIIEVMACRRGCIMGGGQPVRAGDRTKAARAKGLYDADNTMSIKKSDENPLVQSLYEGMLKGREHELLHNQIPW